MKIHFMGIRGSGLAGVARLAEKMGYEVTGCDLNDTGHRVSHLKGIDLLVVTPAVFYQSAKEPELVEGQRKKIVLTWQEFVGKYLQKGKKVIAIAGTHGKSTTTAMAGKLLIDAGFDPSIVMGANFRDWGGGARYGNGDYFVIEADEFYDNFLNYRPEIIILNNIEFDHPDYFKSEKEMRQSYDKFIGNLTGQKILITPKDSLNKKFNLKVLGDHNQENANLVYILGKKLGIKDSVIIKSLETFPGIERRQELISDKNNIFIYDDYAHHPTAIVATIAALREKYPKKRLWAVVEPHGYKRTYALLPHYKHVFDQADKVVIGPIFKARDSKTYGITPAKIAAVSEHRDIRVFEDSEKMLDFLKKEIKKDDVVLVMGAGKSSYWARSLSTIRNETSFKELTTFKIGGKIKYFQEVDSLIEIERVAELAQKNNLPIFILGGGSDILVSDADFEGVVIKYSGQKMRVEGNGVIAEGGASWDDLVSFAVRNKLQGVECLSGIPGTVGAAPIQNIGAYGQEAKDTLEKIKAFDLKKNKLVEFNNSDCNFDYRESIFKKPENWQRYLILEVTFKLIKNGKPCLKYESLNAYLKNKKIKNPSLSEVREAVLALRKEKLEDPEKVPNAGSFFKNPIVRKEIPGIPGYPFGDKFKLYAAWLIEQSGWKGKKYKNVGVSAKNALILVNPEGKGTASQVKELAEKIINDVYKKFKVKLEPEVQFIGFKKKVAILGYGLEGEDAEKYFRDQDVVITILDQKFDRDYLKNLENFSLIVRSPGVYRYLPEITRAEKKGTEITSAVKIFFDRCPGKIIGVTGTKGKGTTSTLIYEILKKARLDVYLVGNIGKPYLELLPKLTSESIVVMELSSFQLIDLKKSPNIAVVLNITSDHLNWHKSQEEYVSAKENIVRYQGRKDLAIVNEEYEITRKFGKLTKGKVILFSKNKLEKKYKTDLLLRGDHNLENIAAAVAVAKAMGISEILISKVLKSFKGLEHRMELVRTIRGVSFYNDSFATGPQPTIAAIKSFSEPETLILGGSDKGLNYDELGREIAKAKQVKKVIVIGTVGPAIIKSLKRAKFHGSIINLRKRSMSKIVKNAFRNTPKGGVVLLSPAAASFDMFFDYKDRGNQFKMAVQNLK